MDKYKIFETKGFLRDVKRLQKSTLPSLEKKLADHVYPQVRELPQYGPNIKRLKGYHPPTWRYRIGDWRFFYEIDEDKKTVFMTVADHRKDAY